jgi:autotransporter-associated beta strand protein
LAFEFRPRSGVRERSGRRARVPGVVVLVVAAVLAFIPQVFAQSLWQGSTSTYETNNNWLPPTTPPSPPIGPGQLAVFDSTGSTTVNVTSASIKPDSWTFNATAQNYTVSGGVVNFSLAGALGGIIDNANSGQTITISNNIGESVAGVQVQLNGTSTLVLLGSNTYTGGTFITGCGCSTILQLGDATHTASIIGDVINQGTFIIRNADTSGITSITNQGGGTTFFRNSATASTAMIVNDNGGTIFLNNSSAGSATIISKNGGGVEFFGSANGGNAQFITNGTGFVDFSGSGGPGGFGTLTAGSIAGSGTYIIGGELVVGSNNLSTEVSGVITDCGCGGVLTKVGSGTLTLSGINTYTGQTNVNGGTLLVTGSIASSAFIQVDTGATLGGTGTVPFTLLSNGATLAPGLPTALGTLTVNDGLLFCSCTFYNMKVTSAGSDLTQVVSAGGAAFAGLAGTVRVTSLNNSYRFNSPYTILTAQGGLGGTQFDSLITPTGINGLLTYTTTDVDLTLMSALGQLQGLNVNQRNVANALDNVFNTTGNSGALGGIFSGNILQNLTQVSGELATGVQSATYNAMNLFISSLTDPFIGGRSGAPSAGGAQGYSEDESASAYAARQPAAARDAFARIPTKADVARNDLLDSRWSVWGTAFGGGANISGNAALGSNSADVRAFGLAAGADYRFSPQTIAGFALAGGGTNFSVAGFGSGRSDLFQAGAFVRHTVGPAYVTGALAYGGQEVTTDRIVTVAGFDRLQARFNANAVSGRVEGGYRFVTPWMGVTPYAAGQFTTIVLPAYAEQAIAGTGNFALAYAAQTATDARSELGARTDRSYAMRDGVLILRGRLAWAHDFTTNRNVGAVFQSLPGTFFVMNGAAQAHDSALTTASAEMHWLNHWSAAATFEGEFSPVMNSYAGKGVVRYTW